jgi:hypothetical protein
MDVTVSEAYDRFDIHVTCLVHLTLLDLIILIVLYEAMKLLIMQFSPTSYHFIPFVSKYSPQRHVLKHHQSVFLP